jgi:hypothetical protein
LERKLANYHVADGAVPLDDSDLEKLGIQVEEDTSTIKEGRIIERNVAYHQSMMVNGTIGTEGFLKEKYVRIVDNIAYHQAVVINANISVGTWQEVREDRFRVLELAAKGAFANNRDPPELQGTEHGHTDEDGRKGNSGRA